jgi:hypothetical protein
VPPGREHGQRKLRDRRDAMISSLAADFDMAVAKLTESFKRKELILTFNFLQAKNIGLSLHQEARGKALAQPDAVNVPCRDSNHGQKKSAQLRRRLGALRFHAAPGGKPALRS